MDRRETKAKDDAYGKTAALEPTRASLACVRRAFANIEAMAVVRRRELAFRTGKGKKKKGHVVGLDMGATLPLHRLMYNFKAPHQKRNSDQLRSSSDTSGIQ
jgi:hypothetical protein